ncbi:hypothetical protein [Salmonirosea aquatica]|uniref:Uncharacterized protein n=1 Tax=Salmonirosea aquatica TaxID=2654236 RepID=A0A7C9F2U8_9BACT|nr:hypothetical protein [Cytophagaceae bacterium SJW1-29]
MEFLKIIYRGKEYSLKELVQETNKFSKDLLLPLSYQIDTNIVDFGLVHDKGYSIAGEKFNDLYSVLASARLSLINAHTKIHKSGVTWNSGYSGQLWLRTQFLQNSILWYNSCEDYFLQIIWFAFDFYSDLENYKSEMRKCSFKNIEKELNNYKSFQSANLLLENLLIYKENENVKNIREISNSIKHKQLIRFYGLDEERNISIESVNFKSTWIDPKIVDIDITINELISVHNSILSLGTFLLEFIKFDAMFPKDKNERIPWGETRPKAEYKKISISDKYAI